MAKRVLSTVAVIILLNVLVGCQDIDSGRGRLTSDSTGTLLGAAGTTYIVSAGETDFVEQVAVNRQAYQRGLELLIGYYNKTGNSMKLKWAQGELAGLNSIPQYKYIPDAELAGADLRASTSIPEADDMYADALKLEKEANVLLVSKNDNLLRLALDKYDRLIRTYPSSDKIDDAAFRAGEIYEYFKDYSIALLYYKRTYQWDPDTIYPARFMSARILDKRLHRNAEALELYQDALKTEGMYGKYRLWRKYAEDRVRTLRKTYRDND